MVDVRPLDDQPLSHGFVAEHVTYDLGGVALISETVGAFQGECPPAKFRSAGIDHWVLVVHKEGGALVETDGNIIEEAPGTITFRSLTRPFNARKSKSKVLSTFIPRDLFPDIAGSLDALNNSILHGGLSTVLGDYLLSLERNLPNIALSDIPTLSDMTQRMIAGCLQPSADAIMDAQQAIGVGLIERVCRYIGQNLHRRSLSPSEVATTFNVSRSKLYRLFESRGGVAAEIRRQRLVASHAALATPSDGRRVNQIAFDFGFGSADEFSKSFRREFRYSPREARERGALRAARPTFGLHGETVNDWLSRT